MWSIPLFYTFFVKIISDLHSVSYTLYLPLSSRHDTSERTPRRPSSGRHPSPQSISRGDRCGGPGWRLKSVPVCERPNEGQSFLPCGLGLVRRGHVVRLLETRSREVVGPVRKSLDVTLDSKKDCGGGGRRKCPQSDVRTRPSKRLRTRRRGNGRCPLRLRGLFKERTQ